MAESTLRELPSRHGWLTEGEPDEPAGPALVIAWYLADPRRVGESIRVPEDGGILGRGDQFATLHFRPDRPGGGGPPRPLDSRLISRKQLAVTRDDEQLTVENIGSRRLTVNGTPTKRATVDAGDVLTLENQLVLVVSNRATWPALLPDHRFGAPDAHGLVGESPAAWELRSRLAFLASRPEPVILRGPSGAGKELAARSLHAGGPFVSRNAATLPEGLIDAELFGNARGYPNSGMPERRGLIGEADGGSLFLDEIGEIPEATQAHLLRVLDADGEYQRLGESRTRRSSFRCVAATNRPEGHLKHDLLARFTHRVTLPGLGERPEDIPLLVAHLLARAGRDGQLAERFSEDGQWRISPGLIEALLRHDWTTHVRELETVLWTAIASSPGRALVPTDEVRALLQIQTSEAPAADPTELTAEAIRAALDSAGGSVSRAARALGLSSRYVLYRQMRRHGIEAP